MERNLKRLAEMCVSYFKGCFASGLTRVNLQVTSRTQPHTALSIPDHRQWLSITLLAVKILVLST